MTEAPRQFQHYEVLRREDGSPWELGRGAMGITYKAYDVNLCCEVALKVVNSALLDNPDARERFVREARAAAALRHRHVASVYHLGNDGAHFFYAMEFIDGETLDALVRRQGPLPVGVTLRMILQVAKALVAADRQSLVHRDLKPTNLMVVHDDADDDLTIKVIDFGLARPASGTEGVASVTLGGFVGTPQYASPEQLEERGLDARSDIYSLGVTAWYLLTGRPPFFGSLAAVCQQQLTKAPPWNLLPPDLPGPVRGLLEHMLEKDPARRPQSARELRAEIETCLSGVSPDDDWVLETGRTDHFRPRQPPTVAPSSSAGVPTTLGNGRFTSVSFLGEEPGVKIYGARDEQNGRSPVTVRLLPGDRLAARADQVSLADEVRLIQAAAHPHLVQIYSVEAATDRSPPLLVEEPLAGFTLHDLLAARGGHLPAAEAVALLAPAAEAVDHARLCRLEHLDLSLRHVRVHFPFALGSTEGHHAARDLAALPLPDWPTWSLKIHPLTTGFADLEPGTWAGDVTLLPRGDGLDVRLPGNRGGYQTALARMVYELLGGAPVVGTGRTAALPGLSEAGNTVLLAAMRGDTVDRSCREFQEALAETVHQRRLAAPPRATAPGTTANGAARSPVTPEAPNALPPPPVEAGPPPRRPASPRASAVPGTRRPLTNGTTLGQPAPSSVAEFFTAAERSPGEAVGGEEAGSVWERMSMTDARAVRPSRWVLGAALAALVFVGTFGGMLVFLLHGGSANPAPRADGPGGKPSPATVASSARTKPAAIRTAASGTPAALPVVKTASPPPVVAPAVAATVRPTVRDVPVEVVAAATALPSPVPTASVPEQPAATPLPKALVSVHVDSQPTGAAIWWHDKLQGVTPLDLQLPPGDHDLIARKRGSLDTHQSLHVDAQAPPAPRLIRLMDPSLVPSFQRAPGRPEPPRNAPGAATPADRGNFRRVPVRPALPVDPPTPGRTPVPRPSQLQPFTEQAGTAADHPPGQTPGEGEN